MTTKCQCGKQIPDIRLEFGYTTCVDCSTEQKRRVYTVFNHKTAPEIVSVDGNDAEALRQADRAYRRAR